MENPSLSKSIAIITIILCVLCSAGELFAAKMANDTFSEGISAGMHKEAVEYRNTGLEYQRAGNLDMAISFYQKAVAMDPGYAVVYNDLGVIYEAAGSLPQAEESYLKAVNIDPDYLSAYTNLALLYENQRKLDKAEFYWSQRASLGDPEDPWTQKAVSRLNDIHAVLSNQPVSFDREDDVLGLMKDVSGQKSTLKKDDKSLSRDLFRKAKMSFDRGDLAMAFKEGLDAQYLDQDNREIEEFIEKVETRALSR